MVGICLYIFERIEFCSQDNVPGFFGVGGGVGRMREVCGTVSAMAMLAGFKYPVLDQQDQEARTKNYAMVQKMSDLFKEKHGTIICRSLLPAAEASQTAPQPSARTAEYYAKRPCSKYVEDAARIAGRMLKKFRIHNQHMLCRLLPGR